MNKIFKAPIIIQKMHLPSRQILYFAQFLFQNVLELITLFLIELALPVPNLLGPNFPIPPPLFNNFLPLPDNFAIIFLAPIESLLILVFPFLHKLFFLCQS